MLLDILGRYPAAEVLRWIWGGRHGIPEAEDEEGSPRLCAVLERGLVSDPGDSGRSPRGDPGGGHAHESFGGSFRGGPHANTLTVGSEDRPRILFRHVFAGEDQEAFRAIKQQACRAGTGGITPCNRTGE